MSLFARDGSVWLNQSQLAELFATSKPNINIHITNILKDKELDTNSVIKDYLTTASDGKSYKVKKLFKFLSKIILHYTRVFACLFMLFFVCFPFFCSYIARCVTAKKKETDILEHKKRRNHQLL